MADTKITALTAITTVDPAVDVLPIVDVSDTSMAASGTTKKITSNQILGAGGTATLASATITGDLTVDTSTLKVDSANNRVGIGTATPGVRFDILSDNNTSLAAVLRVNSNNAAVNTSLAYDGLVGSGAMTLQCGVAPFIVNTNGANERYRIASDGIATWSNVGGVAGTAMTLNATGLGVGASPSFKLDVQSSTATFQLKSTTGTNAAYLFTNNTGGDFYFGRDNSTGATFGSGTGYSAILYSAGAYPMAFFTNAIERMRIDSVGNLGIGVTPSAWGSAWKAVQQQFGGSLFTSNAGSIGLSGNCYNNGTNWLYASGNPATRYEIGPDAGNHRWFIAPTGTSGNAITFTQAMTLDASGNLLVGTTSGLYRGQFAVTSGADRSIFAAQVTGASNGLQVQWNHATTTLRVILANIPTSSAGLASGTLWNDAGTIKIV